MFKQGVIVTTISNGTMSGANEFRSPGMDNSISTSLNRVLPRKTICSIYMSKSASPVIGISFAILDTAMIMSTEINDSLTLTRTVNKIGIQDPSEIILELGCPPKLVSILESNVQCKISLINKRYYKNDLNLIKKSILNKNSMGELNDRPNVSQSVFSLLTYASELYPIFLKFRFKYEPCELTMFIDFRTVRSLELVENLIDRKAGISFYKFFNNTKTKMGERILRNNILQPLSDLESLQLRVASVKELMADTVLLKNLRDFLNRYQDLDRIFNVILLGSWSSSSTISDQNINIVILIKQTIETTREISQLLQNFDSSLLSEIKQIFDDEEIKDVQRSIYKDINEDCNWAISPLELKNQKCYAVKSGKNGLLDISRQIYHNTVNEIMTLIESLAKQFDFDMDSQFDSSRGFAIRIKNFHGEINELPELFVHKILRRGKNVECTTIDLMKLNARMRSTLNEITLLSDQVIESLLENVRSIISVFFMLSEAVAILDLLSCLAHNAINFSNYTFPELNNTGGGKIVIQQSRHPVLDNVNFVANDIISIHTISRLQIITGPNMSGKSVYLKQVLLLVILSQIGSAIPADYAMLPIFNSLHARISNDNKEINASTFSSEMTEMSNILNEVDSKSMVIIDELGRGSSLNDGFAISLAITESLALKNCTTFVSTHFNDIPRILGPKPGFIHLQMKTGLSNGEELIQYHKVNNPSDANVTEGYGIIMAQNYLKNSVIEDAIKILQMLKLKKMGNSGCSLDEIRKLQKRKMILNLVQSLKLLKERDQDSIENLKSLQELFLQNFQKLCDDDDD